MTDKNNEGALFKNSKKREGKKDADYQGQITIDGKSYWLNAWLNTSNDGKTKYMSLKAAPKSGKKNDEPVSAPAPTPIDLDETIPF